MSRPIQVFPLPGRTERGMVYAELFLTPKSDPWLGLKPSDAYSALDHDGVVTEATQ